MSYCLDSTIVNAIIKLLNYSINYFLWKILKVMEAYHMKYDFTSILDRHGKDSIAVDIETDVFSIAPKGTTQPGFDRIPMWVADMNFPTVPTIISELTERVQHPAFGYYAPTDEYYDEIIRWQIGRAHV